MSKAKPAPQPPAPPPAEPSNCAQLAQLLRVAVGALHELEIFLSRIQDGGMPVARLRERTRDLCAEIDAATAREP